jgi:hypothetical protein
MKYRVEWDTEVFEHHVAEIKLKDGGTPDDLTANNLAKYESPDTLQSSEVEARDVTEWDEVEEVKDA